MKILHKGENNPMFNQAKSPEFTQMMYKTEKNNPNAKPYKVTDTLTNVSLYNL
jgi:hypothetical protein